MSTSLRALSNDHNACQLIKLDSDDPKSPCIIMQEGYAASDPNCRSRLFFLQRDGMWIDEVARSARPESEISDIVFASSGEALQTLATLFGPPMIRALPVTEADIQNYLARMKGSSPKDLLRHLLHRYRAAKGSGH